VTTGLTPDEFDGLFQRFADSLTSTSVFRWEARQHYAIPKDEPSLVAFREGTPRPERSVRTSPWLRRIAASTVAGKKWTRVRVLTEPLSEYVRWELLAYVESQAAGERILVTTEFNRDEFAADLLPDFWVFDGDRPADQYAILMHYDETGVPVEFEYRDDPEGLAVWLQESWELADSATPLNQYLAPRRVVSGAA